MKNLFFVVSILAVLFTAVSCSNHRLESDNYTLKQKNQELESKISDLETNQRKVWEKEAVDAYKAALEKAREERESSDLAKLDFSTIDHQLQTPTWKRFVQGIQSANEEENQIQGASSFFMNCFPSSADFYPWNNWVQMKASFKSEPEKFEAWFNKYEPVMRTIKKALGFSYEISQPTMDYLNKEFPAELAKEFERVYSRFPDSAPAYMDELAAESRKGAFRKWGYAEIPTDIGIWQQKEYELCQDMQCWVFHKEYGKEGIAALKRMATKVNNW